MHRLSDVQEFMDYMDSRSKQCDVLAEDLKEYQVWREDKDDFTVTDYARQLELSFAERYMMAIHGVNDLTCAPEIQALYEATGEKPYEYSRDEIADLIHRGEMVNVEGIDSVIDRLEGFSTEWARLKSDELAATGFGEPVFATVGLEGSEQDVYTEEFLGRFLAENLGREKYFERADRALTGIEDVGPGITVKAKDMMLVDKILAACDNKNGELSRNSGASSYGLDCERIFDNAAQTVYYERQRMSESDKAFEAEGRVLADGGLLGAGSARNLSDLESACDGISGQDMSENMSCDVT